MGYLDNAGLAHFWGNVRQYVDENQGGGTANNQAWSTEETVIGTWIDGKPRYRKCYKLSFNPNETITIDANSGYTSQILYADFSNINPTSVKISGNYGNFQLYSFNGFAFYQVKFSMEGLILIVTNPSINSNINVPKTNSIFVCMEYCKFTDTSAT